MPMKKLLILRFPFESRAGGEERHSMQVAEGLRRHGYEVSFLGSDSVLHTMMRKAGFASQKIWGPKPPVTLKTVAVFWFMMMIFALRMVPVLLRYRLNGVRAVYCLSFPDKFLTPLLRLLGMRVVWVEHARIGRWLTRNPYLPLYWLYAWLTKGVVFTSDLARAQARWIPHGLVIPCGIFVDEFTDAKALTLPGVAAQQPVVGVIARFSTDKGVDIFLRAAAIVARQHPEVVFVCCGDGLEENALRSLATSLGIQNCVIFLQSLSRADLGRLYKRLSIVVLPSTAFDPFGLVPGEAMALGKPVVVSDLCGIAGYMKDKVDGMIVRAGSVEDLADALMQLLHDQKTAEKIGANGRKLIADQFSEAKMVDRFYQLWTL